MLGFSSFWKEILHTGHSVAIYPKSLLMIVCIKSFIILKDTFRIILQGTPDNISESAIKERLLSVEGVSSVHDLHLWIMDGQYNIMTVHVVAEIRNRYART